MSSYEKLRLLWIDLSVSVKAAELPDLLQDRFEIVEPHAGSSLDAEIERLKPQLLLFDFDYPERTSMKLLEITKAQHPHIPILMMTVEHSESMAVWAFRSRVWDYLVKPVSKRELERCVTALLEVLANIRQRVRTRSMAWVGSPVPVENRLSKQRLTTAELMPAVAYVEKTFRDSVSSAEAARRCGMDSFRFSRQFRTTFGITFREYLLRFRIKEACRLLERPDISITDVALLSGFNDSSYFSKVFKRYTGLSPSTYASSDETRRQISDDRLALIVEHS